MSVDDIDRAIASATMWCSMHVVLDIAQEAEHIGNWSEGCPCHSNLELKAIERVGLKRRRLEQPRGWMQSARCPFKGCRAPELAAGQGESSLMRHMFENKNRVLSHFAAVPDSERNQMLSDWDDARARLWSVLFVTADLLTQLAR